ncbi:hypothetical protein CHCC14559_3498 [Bacillus licheniformis]|nr:hypothetical protein CHCC20373_4187 [Bacillus licheniformis]TWN17211.1 hypothetical protein CHCC14564_1776 [Bacillus licheniformis LMG 17339]TWL80957.1 hypothetical protein CHCC15311_1296 [Bacillus licheniformis]TWL95745.1 hypothetical protein CHCC15291_0429 [Bacillus licheniformis]TWL95864.1 hypothetical protein CHCC15289_2656 [Bacillus licheniformis]
MIHVLQKEGQLLIQVIQEQKGKSIELESQRRSMYTNSQKWSNCRPFFLSQLVKKGQIQ